MRIVALLLAYNEESYIAAQLEHLEAHGVQAWLIDNASTDRTVEIAKGYLGRNLLGIEHMPRFGLHNLGEQLVRKAELALELDADWFIHLDPDEFRLPPRSGQTLQQALADMDSQGYNAVNFQEFVFIPTRESPDHEHADFQTSMRHYYWFQPKPLHRLNAWKKQPQRVDLDTHGGHRVLFNQQRIAPDGFKMRHYHFLSVPHAIKKFVGRKFPAKELERGMHRWRAQLRAEDVRLPSQKELLEYHDDDRLDASQPRIIQYLGERVKTAETTHPHPNPLP